jgi:hypothetical protein
MCHPQTPHLAQSVLIFHYDLQNKTIIISLHKINQMALAIENVNI